VIEKPKNSKIWKQKEFLQKSPSKDGLAKAS